MSLFVKIETGALIDPRIPEAGPDAVYLWLRGLLFSKEKMTDGFIPVQVLALLGQGLSAKRIKRGVESALSVGLWEKVCRDDGKGGIELVGYTVGKERWSRHQTTKEQVESAREKARIRQQNRRKLASERHAVTLVSQCDIDDASRLCHSVTHHRDTNMSQRDVQRDSVTCHACVTLPEPEPEPEPEIYTHTPRGDARSDETPDAEPRTPPATPAAKLPPSIDTPEMREAWTDWERHAGELGIRMTSVAIGECVLFLERLGVERGIAAIAHSIRHGWRSIHEDAGPSQRAATQDKRIGLARESSHRPIRSLRPSEPEKPKPKPRDGFSPDEIAKATKAWPEVRDALLADLEEPDGGEEWLGPIEAVALHRGELILACPDDFHRGWIARDFEDQIAEHASRILGRKISIGYRVAGGAAT